MGFRRKRREGEIRCFDVSRASDSQCHLVGLLDGRRGGYTADTSRNCKPAITDGLQGAKVFACAIALVEVVAPAKAEPIAGYCIEHDADVVTDSAGQYQDDARDSRRRRAAPCLHDCTISVANQ